MDKDSRNALEETRTVLDDLAAYLDAVAARDETDAHPSVHSFSTRIAAVAADLEVVLDEAKTAKTSA